MATARRLTGIEFARPEDLTPLLLDLYLPDAPQQSGALPAVVHFHGGGWRVGARSSFGPALDSLKLNPIERLVGAGFVVASAEYRLSSVARFPAQLLDAKAAIRWVRANAGNCNVDPDRIFAWGDSAGGHLASLVGLTGGSNDYPGHADDTGELRHIDDTVGAVAAWYPPTDLLSMGSQSLPGAAASADDPGSREALLLGAQPAAAPEKAAAASPVAYVGHHPLPFLLAHGTEDRFVPPAQSTTFASALEAAGADVELLLIEGADHMWQLPEQNTTAAVTAIENTIRFFRRHADKP
ncbi:alpha/beta hydrolase [Arthrobacter agilis]|nr:alpha/beta hydrolase [Arthrobacter agilis]